MAVLTLTMSISNTAMAAEWKQDDVGWMYLEDDGSYPFNTWKWVGDKCYYFDGAGYMLADTITPDGYTVDASGAWLVDVPKVEESPVQTAPSGSEYVGEIPGYVYVPGYGYIDMSNAGPAVHDPSGDIYMKDLSGNHSGTMG